MKAMVTKIHIPAKKGKKCGSYIPSIIMSDFDKNCMINVIAHTSSNKF